MFSTMKLFSHRSIDQEKYTFRISHCGHELKITTQQKTAHFPIFFLLFLLFI